MFHFFIKFISRAIYSYEGFETLEIVRNVTLLPHLRRHLSAFSFTFYVLIPQPMTLNLLSDCSYALCLPVNFPSPPHVNTSNFVMYTLASHNCYFLVYL